MVKILRGRQESCRPRGFSGLPPGPVANPGTDSIEAVLYPADTDYLYFVADRDGHNHYTHNYADHLQVVEQVR